MTEIQDVYNQIVKSGRGRLAQWQRECEARIMQFAALVQPSSPFKDLPKYHKKKYLSQFWTRANRRKREINIYGIAPNIARIKGFNAPVGKWHNTQQYIAPIRHKDDDKTYIRNMRKGQTTAASLPFKTKTPKFFGKPVETEIQYFGIRRDGGVMGLGRFYGGAVPLYYYQSFADYLFEHYRADVEQIIIQAGIDMLNE